MKVLFIGLVWPEPKSSAAGNRIVQLINLFKENNFEVTFASVAQESEFMLDVADLGVDKQQIKLNCPSFDDFIISLNPDIVVFDRYVTEEQFGWRVKENCPQAMLILDTEDLHCLRLARQSALKQNRELIPADLFSDFAKREIASIYRCDISLFVSQYEVELAQKLFGVPDFLLYYLPIWVDKLLLDLPAFETRNHFVFIGNFLHEPNWDAVKYLSEAIWPEIHSQLPDAEMHIYGAYPSQKVLQLHDPKLKFYIKGRAQNAITVVKNARVVLAPLRFGAGIKGKLLEAMQCGTPSITTTIGSEAMHGNLNWNGYIEDNVSDFANMAVQLYQNKTIWQQAQQNGFKIIEKQFQKLLFTTNFIDCVVHIQQELSNHRLKNFTGAMLQHHTLTSTKYMSRWIEEKNKK